MAQQRYWIMVVDKDNDHDFIDLVVEGRREDCIADFLSWVNDNDGGPQYDEADVSCFDIVEVEDVQL